MVTIGRSELMAIGPPAVIISPGIMRDRSADRLVNGHQLGSVRECCFDLDFLDHLCHSLHALVAGNDMGSGLHQIRNRSPIARTFDEKVGNNGHRLRVIELETLIRRFSSTRQADLPAVTTFSWSIEVPANGV